VLSARMRPLRPLNLGACEHFLINVLGVWCILSEKPAWHHYCDTPTEPRTNHVTVQ